jgi:polar amino acid transport system substrate-binding protein
MVKAVLLFCLVFIAAGEAGARDLVVAGIPEEPLRWMAADGQPSGIDVEILTTILNKIGVPFHVLLVPSSARLMAEYQAPVPECDMVFTFSKTAEREPYLSYASESHLTLAWNFFLRKENEGHFRFTTYRDLAGLTIGVTTGFAYTEEFLNAVKDGTLKVDPVVDNSLQMTKLLAGRIDLVPLNTLVTLYEARKGGWDGKIASLPKPLKETLYYNTFVRKSTYPGLADVERKYNEVLKQMKADGSLRAILDRYGFR